MADKSDIGIYVGGEDESVSKPPKNFGSFFSMKYLYVILAIIVILVLVSVFT